MSSEAAKGSDNQPRLCHVIKNPQFDGYGFNLHAEKNKPGQYIGKVDEGSPAEAAGLREGDRILEVNGADISKETHKQVVQRIKTNPNETKLLVVSPNEADATNHHANTTTTTTTTTTTETDNQLDHETPEPAKIPENGSAELKLNMTVAEMRAQLANRKKYDPKKESIDFKKKFDIIQKL